MDFHHRTTSLVDYPREPVGLTRRFVHITVLTLADVLLDVLTHSEPEESSSDFLLGMLDSKMSGGWIVMTQVDHLLHFA